MGARSTGRAYRDRTKIYGEYDFLGSHPALMMLQDEFKRMSHEIIPELTMQMGRCISLLEFSIFC
jgi:hypothetical protein